MKAITIWRPWDQAILYGGKDVENRTWALWKSMIGKPIAMHAGKNYDHDGARWMRERGLYVPPPPEDSPQGIVGVVIFDRVVVEHKSPWFFGPHGWHISDVFALPVTLSCQGKQGLWNVPPAIEYSILKKTNVLIFDLLKR